ncbi:uncharacterized protein CIMG_13152 [Coccidioides immitis RS]|uniref:Uncharacterized protein n=1 Tax=Coccidioides immitis (strain RS) TaxID=246410 RepID=J3KA97_COCIM|nr:uncharacterized protein CIMG_13152 [Coccidioides immitis RS]EAS31922.3 hypothetical protein CIMG_13152 [Coccidioides immitis RS]
MGTGVPLSTTASRTSLSLKELMLLLTAKNLKLLIQHAIWSGMCDAFFCIWNQAVDRHYLTISFYNIGKKVVSLWSFLSHQESTHVPCMFICHVQQRVMSEASDSSNIQYRLVELALRSEDEDAYQPELSKSSEDEDDENTSNLNEHSAGGALVANAQASDSEHEYLQKESWCKQFYLLLFLHDLGSMMLELHQCSLLCCWSLLYCQFYNTIKKIFVASKHSLFANENLDILALDPGLVWIWQHIGKAISHSSLALLHMYIHTK